MSELNHRARKILAAVVQEYLATGEAVGSRTVTRRGIDLSPATVRNVMSDLEEAGLLVQPHTSAGRVPTDSGLRFFVDSLLKVRHLNAREKEELRQRYAIDHGDLDTALREASRVLAELSAHTVVLLLPRPEVDVLEHVEFVRLRDKQLIAILLTKSGKVHNRLVEAPEPPAADELERINNYLNHALGGLTLDGVVQKVREELASERVRYQDLEKRALELSAQAIPDPAEGKQLIVEGQAKLVETLGSSPDPAEAVQKLKALWRTLEEKQHLLELLESTAKAPGLQVFIGAETHIDELKDFTLVTANYGLTGADGDEPRPLGTLGVIGPTRMNYSRVINLVDFTAQLVSGVITKR